MNSNLLTGGTLFLLIFAIGVGILLIILLIRFLIIMPKSLQNIESSMNAIQSSLEKKLPKQQPSSKTKEEMIHEAIEQIQIASNSQTANNFNQETDSSNPGTVENKNDSL